jgi:hypothetical protein
MFWEVCTQPTTAAARRTAFEKGIEGSNPARYVLVLPRFSVLLSQPVGIGHSAPSTISEEDELHSGGNWQLDNYAMYVRMKRKAGVGNSSRNVLLCFIITPGIPDFNAVTSPHLTAWNDAMS